MKPTVTEIAPDIFRIAVQAPDISIACFLIRDEQPAMIETGFENALDMFTGVRQAVGELIDIASLRYIFVPHFEADECGSINRFFELAPNAEAVCSPVGASVTMEDSFARPPRTIGHGESIVLGKKTITAVVTPWVHLWDSMLLHDETDRVLFTSDLFGQMGEREPMTGEDRSREIVETGLLSGVYPSQKHLERALDRIEPLAVDVLACHHGSVLAGNPQRYYRALRDNPVGDVLDAPFYDMRP
jgi:flavorubredoxin